MNIDRFTDGARKSLADAMDIAEQHSHKELLPVHLALALLEPPPPDESQVGTVLRSSPFALAIKDAGGDVEVFRRRIKIEFALEESQEPRPKTIGISSSTSKILRNALSLIESRGDKGIAVNHLIWSIVQDLEIRGLLDVANISDINAFDVVLSKPKAMEEADSNANGGDHMVNLTSLAGAGKIDRVIGRDEEIRYLIKILLHRTRNNPILVGERGVGKTSIVKGLAQRISAGDVPSSLLNWRILSLDTSSLTADIDSKEKLEERLCQIVKEIEGSKVATCLFIDNIHLLVESVRREHSMDSSDLLKSVLAKVKLHHCIATTTPAEFQKYTKKNKALEERFVQISVKGPTIRDTVSILRSLKSNWETHYGVQISDDAITEAATLAGHNLPQSAIDLIDETAATVQLTTESGPEAVQGLERKNEQLKAEIQTLERDASESSVQ